MTCRIMVNQIFWKCLKTLCTHMCIWVIFTIDNLRQTVETTVETVNMTEHRSPTTSKNEGRQGEKEKNSNVCWE